MLELPSDVASTNQDNKNELKMHERYNADDADLELVSSDGTIFKVHSYQLQAAS